MNITKLRILGFLILLIFISSCRLSERFVYFQGDQAVNQVSTSYSPLIKPDDILSIIVSSDKPESAKPFNFQRSEMGIEIQRPVGAVMPLGVPILDGYLVDEDGFVALPIIGRIKVAGLTRKQVMEMMVPIYAEFLSNPVVNIKIMNFRVSVLGDVRNPGVKLVTNERITILEALALAGDLNPTANRKNILIIREKDDQRFEFIVNLTQKNLFSSPAYFLEQNDVIYVEPTLAAQTQGTFWRTSLPTIAGLASFVVTTILLITR
mgnify:CR=1 FL=1